METTEKTAVDPSRIMQIGIGFWASKTLLVAVNMGLFTQLAKGGLTGEAIQAKLGLHSRSLYDFLDTLVALGFLQRSGLKETAVYTNAGDADLFLDKNKPTYVGGILEMANNRLYPFWNNLEEGLKTGKLQNEAKTSDKPFFEEIYADPSRLRDFVRAMGGVQMGNFIVFSKAFDFTPYHSLCDIGGAGGLLAAQVAINNPHMKCITFDLPPVGPIAAENLQQMKLSDRVTVASGDMFADDFPKADIITMGNILHDWGTAEKLVLIEKAYKALPAGGALVIIENIIDDDRRQNAFGLMMSLNMLIETPNGYDFSKADFDVLAKKVGFSSTAIIPLAGPSSALIGIK